MAKPAILSIKILADASQASKTMDKAASRTERLEKGVSKLTGPALAVGAGLTVLGKKALDSASTLQQAQGAVESVFGKSAAAVEEYASTSADRLGVAKSAYLESAALMGAALQNAGFSAQEAAKITDESWGRAADMAATYGGTAAEAMEAMNAAIGRGEWEQMERYAAGTKQAEINALLAARGQDKLTGAALENAKAQAGLDIIMKKTAKTEGQFARESDTAAVQQQKMSAQAENAAASIGQILLPVVASAAGALAGMASWAGENATAVQIMAGVLGGLAASVLLVNGALKVYAAYTAAATAITNLWNNSILILRVRLLALAAAEKVVAAAQKAWAAAQWLLNAAMTANPIGIVIAAVVALVAALVLAYKKSETFRNIVNGAFAAVMNVVRPVIDWLGKYVPKVWQVIVKAVTTYVRIYMTVVRTSFNIVRKIVTTVINVIRKVITTAWRVIASVVKTYVAVYRKVITTAFNLVKKVVTTSVGAMVKVVRGITGKVRSALSGLGNVLRNIFTGAWNKAKTAVTSAIGSIMDTIRGLPGKIRNLGSSFKSAGSAIITAFVNGMKSVGGIAGDMASSIWSVLKGLINSAIDSINKALEFKINLPGPKDINVNPPNIPRLAEGGIVRSPTLAVVGDNSGSAGEAVIPLDKYDLGTGPITVEVHLDGRVVGTYVQDKIDSSMARQARRVVARPRA